MDPLDPAEEERRALQETGVLDDRLRARMDIYLGDTVRWRFLYGETFEEVVGEFLGFFTLFEGPEGGGDVNLMLKVTRDGGSTVIYKDRAFLVEYEVVGPNEAARERFQRMHAKHGRGTGKEFG